MQCFNDAKKITPTSVCFSNTIAPEDPLQSSFLIKIKIEQLHHRNTFLDMIPLFSRLFSVAVLLISMSLLFCSVAIAERSSIDWRFPLLLFSADLQFAVQANLMSQQFNQKQISRVSFVWCVCLDKAMHQCEQFVIHWLAVSVIYLPMQVSRFFVALIKLIKCWLKI